MSGWVTAAYWVAAAVTAVSTISSAQQAKKSAETNAQIAERNAEIAKQKASADAAAQNRMSRQHIGAMEANYSASGVALEGSPLEVIEQSTRDAELDRLNILYGGEVRANNYGTEASIQNARGSNAMTSGYLSAASSLSSSYAKSGQLTQNPGGSGAATQSYDSPIAYGGTTDARYSDL